MTLDEMIKHHIDMARLQENRGERWKKQMDDEATKLHNRLAADHRQLAEWLTELLQRREQCAQYKVEQISNLEQYDMLSREYEILNERYKEAKRLLKLAVEDYPDLTDMWRYADKALKLINDEK